MRSAKQKESCHSELLVCRNGEIAGRLKGYGLRLILASIVAEYLLEWTVERTCQIDSDCDYLA
jgi:hypothetical protein